MFYKKLQRTLEVSLNLFKSINGILKAQILEQK